MDICHISYKQLSLSEVVASRWLICVRCVKVCFRVSGDSAKQLSVTSKVPQSIHEVS